MQIPASPLLLLAAAGIAVIAGRFLHVRIHRMWGLIFFATILFVVCWLPTDPIIPVSPGERAHGQSPFIDDALARSEQWLVLAFGLIAGIAVIDARGNEKTTLSLYGFLLFAVAALTLIARANDFLSLGLSFELANLVLIALLRPDEAPLNSASAEDHNRRGQSHHNWFAWFALGWMWIGIAIVANGTGTTNLEVLRLVLANAFDPTGDHEAIGTPSKSILLGVGLIVTSLFARMGLVPFHLGFATARNHRCTTLAGFSILCQQMAAATALIRIFGVTCVGMWQSLSILTMTICLASFVMAGIIALRGQSPGVKSINYWIASLTLLQNAWFGVALMVATIELGHSAYRWGAFESQMELPAICFYLQLTNLLSGCGMYWTLSHLTRDDREVAFLEDFKGLVQFATLASVTIVVAMASAIGAPLTAGSWGRWLLLLAGSSVHIKSANSFVPHAGLRFVMMVGTVATIVCMGAVIRLAREIFLESPLARPTAVGGRGPLVAGAIAGFFILLMGIAPDIVLIPLRNIQARRVVIRQVPQNGSGQVPMGLRLTEPSPEIP